MNLYCCETADYEIRAQEDPTLLDDRVLRKLLRVEEQHMPSSTYSTTFQEEVTNDMRRIVAEWMMEVCEEQNCQDEVFPLAMNYMNRFLLSCSIKKNQLQLLGTTCMLIASKLRQPKPLGAHTLVYYTNHSITIQLLSRWELLVVSKLKWHMAAITPQDFLPHLLKRLREKHQQVGIGYEMVNKHAKTLIALCAKEIEFFRYYPSVIACASVASALSGLGWTTKVQRTMEDLLEILQEITLIEADYIKECLRQIENMVTMAASSSDGSAAKDSAASDEGAVCEEAFRPDEFTPPPGKLADEHAPAYTPIDVHDIHF